MAQVTMTGQEFRSLVKAEEQKEELLNVFVKAQQVTFTPNNIGPYSAGEFAGVTLPKWVEETLVKCMEAQLILKEDDELALWFKSKCFYFVPVERKLSPYDWDNGINMLDYSDKLRERYEAWKEGQEDAET